MRTLAVFFVLFISITGVGNSQSKLDDIERLLEITNAAQMGLQVLEGLLPQFQAIAPGAPQDYWDALRDEFDAAELVELIKPIYDRHYTHDDIRGLIRFYESPLGQKVISATPAITQESMTAGQSWGQSIAERIYRRLVEDEYVDQTM